MIQVPNNKHYTNMWKEYYQEACDLTRNQQGSQKLSGSCDCACACACACDACGDASYDTGLHALSLKVR